MTRTFKNDYRLNAADSARITCQAVGCDKQATTSQNEGSAPFNYMCDEHAEMGRSTGKFYRSAVSA
jgi:hypothetical protein